MSERVDETLRESVGAKLLKFGMDISQDAETMLHDPNVAYPGAGLVLKLGESALWLASIVLPEQRKVTAVN